MRSENWQKIETLFHAALELNVKERGEYLQHYCAGDEALRREVESLLASADTRDEFLDQPIFEAGIGLMGRTQKASLTGKTIGSYVIKEKLGSGGMGEVYLAEDTQLDRKVALKFLSHAFVNDNWAKRQLMKEARAAAMLENKNICAVYGFEEVGEYSFIVMQYVAGQTLAELIAEGGIAPAEALSIAEQILEALAAAHAHGIIHRDIKPSNIIVTPDRRVKVLDFGLAKLIQSKSATTALSETLSLTSKNGFIAGTVAYMSPEQLRGEKLDFRSDIFSFGVLLFELVTGKRPFDRKSDAETISSILTATPASLKSFANIAPGIERLISKCLEKNKEQRYQSANEILLDLQNPSASGWTARLPAFQKKSLLAPLLLLALLISVGVYRSPLFSYFGQNKTHRLAVMPVVNQSSDAALDYLSEGITESLINRLAKSSQLRVKPYTSVANYKNAEHDYIDIALKLEVESVVVSKFIKRDNDIFLQSSLIKVVDNSKVWSEDIPYQPLSPLSVEEKLSEEVISHLPLDENESDAAKQGETQYGEAFQYYMLGQYYWRRRSGSKENLSKAIDAFSRATEIDASYARAYAGLANAYIVQSNPAYGAAPAREARAKAIDAANKSLVLGDNLAESHAAKAVVSLRYEYEWKKAESEFKRAILLNPEYADARYWYSDYLATMGRTDEALEEAEKAKKLDPASLSISVNVGRVLYYGRRYDDALNYFNELVAKEPNNLSAKYMLGLIYLQTGRQSEAIQIFEQLFTTNINWTAAALGYTYGKVGRKEDARRILAEMDKLFPNGVPPQEKAIVHIGLGENDKAIDFLREAWTNRLSTLPGIKVEPLYDDLRADQRFKDLLFYMDFH